MKKSLVLILFVICISCGKEKVVLLPEITHSEITEINDVSAAYLFYDETKKDSVELNRKNLISTTNWLVNVDKRLTLKQVIPHIKFLQEKKRNSSHKNENAKNYFTCNDTSRQSLGFLEFTNVIYEGRKVSGSSNNIFRLFYKTEPSKPNYKIYSIYLKINKDNTIEVENYKIKIDSLRTTINSIQKEFIDKNEDYEGNIILYFDKDLTFQDYITFKSSISKIEFNKFKIWNIEEFISY